MGLFYFPKTVDTVHPIRYHEHMLNKLKNAVDFIESGSRSDSVILSFLSFISTCSAILLLSGSVLGIVVIAAGIIGTGVLTVADMAINMTSSLFIPLLTLVSASVAVGALAGYAKGCRTVPQTTKRLEL